MNHARILDLVGFNANLQLAHWQADTVTNEHRALGDLYDALAGMVDTLAEVVMGKDGSNDFDDAQLVLKARMDLGGLLEEGQKIITEARAELALPQDEDLANILADMSAAICKARYLLKV